LTSDSTFWLEAFPESPRTRPQLCPEPAKSLTAVASAIFSLRGLGVGFLAVPNGQEVTQRRLPIIFSPAVSRPLKVIHLSDVAHVRRASELLSSYVLLDAPGSGKATRPNSVAHGGRHALGTMWLGKGRMSRNSYRPAPRIIESEQVNRTAHTLRSGAARTLPARTIRARRTVHGRR